MNLNTSLPCVKTELPGPVSKELFAQRTKEVPQALGTMYPVTIKRGAGAMIEDFDGNLFLDFIGGVGVLNIGYSHPEVIEVVKNQSDLFFHSMFNITTHKPYLDLAAKLNQIAPVAGEEHQTFFATSGAEANENAIKIAKSYTGRKNVICFSRAFHGRTLMTMTLTAKKAYSKGIGADAPGVFRAQYPYLYQKDSNVTKEEYIRQCLDSIYELFEEAVLPSDVAAFILEPLQGEGGFIPADLEWIQGVKKICEEHGILLIVDEVQAGFCRTGKMFASEYFQEVGVKPDIITVAKSIAAGLPLSAVIANKEITSKVIKGTIGGTYGGNALSCSAALKVIEIMERDDFAKKSLEIGAKVTARYQDLIAKYGIVGDVRGMGAMIGLEIVTDQKSKKPNAQAADAIIKYCYNHGLMIESAGTYSHVLRFLAPLVITDEQLEAGLDIIEAAIKEVNA